MILKHNIIKHEDLKDVSQIILALFRKLRREIKKLSFLCKQICIRHYYCMFPFQRSINKLHKFSSPCLWVMNFSMISIDPSWLNKKHSINYFEKKNEPSDTARHRNTKIFINKAKTLPPTQGKRNRSKKQISQYFK